MDNNGSNTLRDHNTPLGWMRAILWLIWRIVLYTVLVVGTVYALGRLKVLIIYIVIGTILAYIMRPMATWMIQRPGFVAFHDAIARACASLVRPLRTGLSGLRGGHDRPGASDAMPSARRSGHAHLHMLRTIATLYVLALVLFSCYFAAKFVLTPFVSQISYVTKHWDIEYRPRFEHHFAAAREWYTTHVRQEWRDRIEKPFKQSGPAEGVQQQATAVAGEVGKHVVNIAHQIVEIVLLPVLAFYFALDSRKIKHEFVGVLPRRRRKEVARMIYEFNQIMHSYVVGQAILCALAGVVVGLWLVAWHVPFALTLGLLAGLTRAIPIIGPIIGGIPIIILTLVTAGPTAAVAVLAFFTFLHFAESKFVMPMLIGERMNLHPVIIIVVLLIGQEFGGLLGMFFAPPLAALARVMIRRYWLRCHAQHRRVVSVPALGTARVPTSVGRVSDT